MKIKTIIIDDEKKAISILKNKLERFCPNIELIAGTQYPKKGIELINKLKPDLIFLDIAMPELNGFEVLKQFNQPNFEIIFATAFDDYAIKAIKYCAIGYLVKPIDNSDLVNAVKNATKNIENKTSLLKNKQLIENLNFENIQNKKIVIPDSNGLKFIKIKSIIHCEGDSGYTKIHLKDENPILSSNSIGYFKNLLNDSNFYLIHKSHLINTNYIKQYLNEGVVILENNKSIPVSRNKRADFLNSLK